LCCTLKSTASYQVPLAYTNVGIKDFFTDSCIFASSYDQIKQSPPSHVTKNTLTIQSPPVMHYSEVPHSSDCDAMSRSIRNRFTFMSFTRSVLLSSGLCFLLHDAWLSNVSTLPGSFRWFLLMTSFSPAALAPAALAPAALALPTCDSVSSFYRWNHPLRSR
jgi:hypothetical protein